MGGNHGFQQGVADRLGTYQEKYKHWQGNLSRLKNNLRIIAWIRLALFVGAFSIPFLLTEPWSSQFILLFVGLISIFSGVVYYSLQLGYKKKYAEKRCQLIELELKTLTDKWQDLTDGKQYVDADHDYVHDLDLFGKGSLFQFINRTSTKRGEHRFADQLKSISLYPETIHRRQAAIAELAEATEFREDFYALGAIAEEENKKDRPIEPEKVPDLKFITPFWKIIALLFPFLFVASVVGALANLTSSSLILWLFFTGLGITAKHLRQINTVHKQVSALGSYLKRYSRLLKITEETTFHSDIMNELKSRMAHQDNKASVIVKKLARLLDLFDQRFNMLLGAVINGFFLWDLIICLGIRKWYSKYGEQLNEWFLVLEEIEAMNCFAAFTYNHPDYTFPATDSETVLEAVALGHPLIPPHERVSNDFVINKDKHIGIVTGANMAGKSTFLRTIGVNLVLAGNGSKVAAQSFKYRPMRFITNMRAIDNLLKHESYFFSELKRLKSIVETLQQEGQLFFILDEILKGTNSHDKTNGSIKLVKRLMELNGYGLVATHDLELGQLANEFPGQIFNNCFEVSFENDNLNFDYKLRDGITQSHNASFLMRKMGLISEQ